MKIQILTPTSAELDRLLAIWLQGNLDAHPFIPASYWQGMAPAVATQLPQATLYVARNGSDILGFAGLQGTDIAGIFVARDSRDQGVGHALMTRLQADYNHLSLSVYTANAHASRFYRQHGFQAQPAVVDPETQQLDQCMTWTRA